MARVLLGMDTLVVIIHPMLPRREMSNQRRAVGAPWSSETVPKDPKLQKASTHGPAVTTCPAAKMQSFAAERNLAVHMLGMAGSDRFPLCGTTKVLTHFSPSYILHLLRREITDLAPPFGLICCCVIF